ncbi:Ger(x)C family spore germination protein [Paenibacillus mendelii]|uniref:Ger(X)C family spore germination protein n=1 Tax=Paenibacillus mendelii TaxID=206163 RepID=A0ABV6JA96_9BACL|nr:Ger(x)C family spore germination protein [Paenibacillus mendelii]MCQ6560794.1 Ger(x)C family spore germination protein [Paenibacillus mendelii]
MSGRMWRRMGLLGMVLFSSVLCGCWDSTNLETIDYITAIGVDYKEGKFILYSQLIDFAAVAKTEGPKKEKSPVWVGRGSGITFYDAYNEMQKASQTMMSTEQLKVVVIREPAMTQLDEILDALNRVRVARYTSWMFGTRAKIEEVFVTDHFFGRSQQTSLLYNPKDQMRRVSMIEPLNMQRFVANYNEKAMTVLLPSVRTTTRTWKENEEPLLTEEIDGLYAFKLKDKATYFPIDKIEGIRWFNADFQRYLIAVVDAGGDKATIAIEESRHKIEVKFKDGEPLYTVRLKLTGEVAEVGMGMKRNDMTEQLEKKVRDQVLEAYKQGIKQGEDLLNLEEELFRHHAKEWKKLHKQTKWLPGINDLDVKVNVVLKHSGGFILK